MEIAQSQMETNRYFKKSYNYLSMPSRYIPYGVGRKDPAPHHSVLAHVFHFINSHTGSFASSTSHSIFQDILYSYHLPSSQFYSASITLTIYNVSGISGMYRALRIRTNSVS
jgi:hypothetical protein